MLYSADFPEGFRAAVEIRGFKLGKSRQPLSEDQKIDKQQLSNSLQCILADFGFVDQPSGGCPTKNATSAQPEVDQITQSVMQKLREKGIA